MEIETFTLLFLFCRDVYIMGTTHWVALMVVYLGIEFKGWKVGIHYTSCFLQHEYDRRGIYIFVFEKIMFAQDY